MGKVGLEQRHFKDIEARFGLATSVSVTRFKDGQTCIDTEMAFFVNLRSTQLPSSKLYSIDPENHHFSVETNFPTPMTARVYINFTEGTLDCDLRTLPVKQIKKTGRPQSSRLPCWLLAPEKGPRLQNSLPAPKSTSAHGGLIQTIGIFNQLTVTNSDSDD